MERLLFKRVEMWAVALALLLLLAAGVCFGWMVHERSLDRTRFGVLGDAAMSVATFPTTAREILRFKDPRLAESTQRFDGKGGWSMTPAMKGHALQGYLLLSRISGDADQSSIELLDLSDFSIRHVWLPDADKLLGDVVIRSRLAQPQRFTRKWFRVFHPLLLPDGDLIIKNDSPLLRVDGCSRRKWVQAQDIFHHSTNLAGDGTIWVPSVIEPTRQSTDPEFEDDGIVQISPADGRILFEKSAADILVKNGFMPLLFGAGAYTDDPTHVNDIQPVLADGPYWKKGDLFISIRNRSLLLLYRPSEDRVLWSKQGPWMGQHDIDIIDDHTIAVFDNGTYDRGKGDMLQGTNEIMFYDFANHTLTSPYKDVMKALDIRTVTEGLYEFLPGGEVIIEEENSGRIVILDKDKTLLAEFVNRASDGKVYYLGWSRYVDQATGDAAIAALARMTCTAP